MQKIFFSLLFFMLLYTGIKADNKYEISNTLNITNANYEKETYNYRVGQRDLTFVIKIKNNKVLKVIGYLGNIFRNSIMAKVAKMLTTDSLLYDTFSIIGFKHVSFEIGSNIFDENSYSDVYEYTEYDGTLGVFQWPNAKIWNDPDGFFKYNLMDWESLSKYQGSTYISSVELNKMIDRKKFPTEEFKLIHIFSNGKYQSYDFFRNNCHDFVQHCLELVGHPDTSKFVTYKVPPQKILQKRIENMTEDWVKNLIKSLENKTCDLSIASNTENNNNTISIYNNLINTYGYIDDSDDCHSLIDKSLLNISDDNKHNDDYINDNHHYQDHDQDQKEDDKNDKGKISDNNLNNSEIENINEIINSLGYMVNTVVENVKSSININYNKNEVTYVTPKDGGIWISINAKSSDHLVSAYYHPTKYHYTRAVGKSDPGRFYAAPGEWAIAVTDRKEKGNKTFFNVSNCSGSDSCDKDLNDDKIDHWMSGSIKSNHFSFFSIFIILTSIFIWQSHIIF